MNYTSTDSKLSKQQNKNSDSFNSTFPLDTTSALNTNQTATMELSSNSQADFIEHLKKNNASIEDVAKVLADVLYATDAKAEPDYSSRLKAAETILKAMKVIGPIGSGEAQNNFSMNVIAKELNLFLSKDKF